MPTKEETLEQLRQYIGDENYRKLVDQMGGEDALWERMGSTSVESSSPEKSSASSEPWTAGDTLAFLLAALIVLAAVIVLCVSAYQTGGWGDVVVVILISILYGFTIFQFLFQLIRHIGWVLGAGIVIGITGLLLYGLFKLGVFVIDSTGSFFEWLFGHF